MSIQASMVVTDTVSNALTNYAGLRAFRGKGLESTMRNVMKIWVGLAYAAIKRRHYGRPDKIERELMAITALSARARKARGKVADKYRGTLAAKLVVILARDPVAVSALSRYAFYNKARRLVGARRASAGVHMAGMIPAMRALRSGVPVSKIKHPPGSFMSTVLNDAADMLVENFASGRSRRSVGIAGIVPEAFQSVIGQLESILARLYQEDMVAGARQVGLTATTP